ncbi:hypothetical protein [Actinomadura livida]|uniref:Uncharacterized protein n=2 Tax=Actinomadura livida TaxID=79909 RepID=A0A7W7IAK2_9ACTN|nr:MULTISPECIES: hypothetical protein [Actinomadura]MBB4773431.1 hypothetical protein [Actinomadura catellatispora]
MGMQERRVLSPDAPVPDGVVDAGTAPATSRIERLTAGDAVVLVTLETDAPEPDPALLAAASVYAWLGVKLFRVPESQAEAVSEVLDMVASIEGTRPPAVSRRGLA